MYSPSGFLVLSPQADEPVQVKQQDDTYPSSVSGGDDVNFLVLSPHHRRASVSSTTSTGSSDTVNSVVDGKQVTFLGLTDANAKPVAESKQPDIIPDTDCVNVMKPFRKGFLRLG
ncbi:hypothetical protein KEM55_009288 [Ascosphaera atra]|nr:hypothetical protein KEM55_009288 [Ascosphaera atra]